MYFIIYLKINYIKIKILLYYINALIHVFESYNLLLILKNNF